MQTRSGGSGEGVHANPFGQVRRGHLCKLIWVGWVRASLKTHLGGSGEGVRANSFGRVERGHSGGLGKGIRENSFGRVGQGNSCQLIHMGQARQSLQNCSGGSSKCMHVNSFGQVGRVRARANEPV